MPFKCNIEQFLRIYQELYKAKISHRLIRNILGLSENTRLKLNGTFGRQLYLLDEDDKLYSVECRIQTALWTNPQTGKKCYVSIFPNFIKRYCPPCLHVLEYISWRLRKGENFFSHIDDPERLIYYEDHITGALKRLERECVKFTYSALLNSKYTEIFNNPLTASSFKTVPPLRFPELYTLIVISKKFFGRQLGVLALANTILTL